MIRRASWRKGFVLVLMRAWSLMVTTTTTTAAFVVCPTSSITTPSIHSKRLNSLLLNAKKGRRDSSSKISSGGGFGKTTSPNTDESSASTTKISFASRGVGAGTKALRKVANQFDRLRQQYGVKWGRDIYIRSPLHSLTTFWFVGKIARQPPPPTSSSPITNSTDDEHEGTIVPKEDDDKYFAAAAIVLKRIILEYSKEKLRPQTFGGKYAPSLELWMAPPDSEMDVATNKVTLTKVERNKNNNNNNTDDDINNNNNNNISYQVTDVTQIGYNPEIYVGDEVEKGGLRVERDENGVPIKPVFEVNESA